MLSKNDIKFIRSLGQSKQRKKERLFLAEGSKIIKELLDTGFLAKKIFTLDSSNFDDADHVIGINERELKLISNQKNPQDALGIFEMKRERSSIHIGQGPCLVCDQVQDPGNMGTILRIADWFGIRQVVCSPDCADIYNPKVVQSSMGSLGRTDVYHRDLVDWLKEVKGNVPILATSLSGNDLFVSELPENAILVLGNESKGVSPAVIEMADALIKIPSYGQAESLNVAIATGIICAELRRRN